ncbi:MAG: hypothetical protein ACREAA_20620 [Candidatus Polarisedimenticolia bacterium]
MRKELLCGVLMCLAASALDVRAQDAPGAPLPPDPNGPGIMVPQDFIDPSRPVALPPWFDDPNAARSQDPKALEILKAGIAALGGDQAILGRKTIYIKRKVVNHEYPEPREGTVTLWFKRPNLMRKEIVYPGQKHTEAFDGRRAWFDSGTGPRWRGDVLTASILNGMAELDVPANYLDAELTYFNISQELPGKLTHVVKVRKNGYTRELMFDVSTSLLEVCGEYENPWGATDKMTKYERYRPVNGVMVPYKVQNFRANTLISETEVLEVRFNEAIDDGMFRFPGSPAP